VPCKARNIFVILGRLVEERNAKVKLAIPLLAVGLILLNLTSGSEQYDNKLWKQKIVLLQSMRDDVEKLFGKPPLGHDFLVAYKFDDGMLDVEYYPFDHCTARNGVTPFLNVPAWTVTEMEFRPDTPPKVPSLALDLKPLRKEHSNPHLPDFLSYVDDQQGIEYTIDEHTHRLSSVRYFLGARYDSLRCPKK
jgi:hypothetical protein